MGEYKKHWWALVAVLIVTFTLLGWGGVEVYRSAPPVPEKFVDSKGQVVISKEDILQGQSAWQTTGGMQLGSVLGHGAYQAPDWTADWLHRELVAWLDIKSQECTANLTTNLIKRCKQVCVSLPKKSIVKVLPMG